MVKQFITMGGGIPMAPYIRPPEATLYRLALYDCHLGETIRSGEEDRLLTSSDIAGDLGIRETTVRRDLSYVAGNGRRGIGYRLYGLHSAIQECLGLREDYPVVRIGTATMLQALEMLIPADSYGVSSVAYFSELPEEVGIVVGERQVAHVTELPNLDPDLDAQIALVACSKTWLEPVLELLLEAGITGAFVLTPKVRLAVPDGMSVRHLRMPCDMKTLAHTCAARGQTPMSITVGEPARSWPVTAAAR